MTSWLRKALSDDLKYNGELIKELTIFDVTEHGSALLKFLEMYETLESIDKSILCNAFEQVRLEKENLPGFQGYVACSIAQDSCGMVIDLTIDPFDPHCLKHIQRYNCSGKTLHNNLLTPFSIECANKVWVEDMGDLTLASLDWYKNITPIAYLQSKILLKWWWQAYNITQGYNFLINYEYRIR